MEFVCSVRCEELNSSFQIIFSVKIKPFLILLFLNKLVGCSFLSEPMKSMVTLIFKMLLKQKISHSWLAPLRSLTEYLCL